MGITISQQTRFPAFIERGGQLYTRKLFEYRIIEGKVVVVDLPEPGHQPEYLDAEGVRLWQENNKRILQSARK